MAATLPDVTPSYGSLTEPAVPQSNRPIVGYNAGGPQAAVAELGQDAMKVSDQLFQQQTELQTNTAKSNYMNDMVNFKDSPEERDNPDTAGAPARWAAASSTAMKKYAPTIMNPQAQKMFQASAPMETKGFENQYLQTADAKRRDMGKASVLQQGEQLSGAFMATNDPKTQTGIVNTYLNSLDNAEKTGLISSTEKVNESQKWQGQVVSSTVSKALTDGNVDYANRFYQGVKESLPGYAQAEIEKQLHGSNMQVTGDSNASSLLLGKPLTPVAVPPTAIKARSAVADAATAANVDPNTALTTLHIESSDGLNVGTRGDIGQTGKGGDLPTQAQNLVGALKDAHTVATNALGRESLPWEDYLTYQQGNSGGPALLKAAGDPNANAVDVLTPFYKDSATALSAIKRNGGNATMNAGQFVSMIQQKYSDNYQRAAITVPGAEVPTSFDGTAQPANGAPAVQGDNVPVPTQSLGAAIQKPYQSTGPSMQPAATPVQQLNEMDKVYPSALQRAMQIPNIAEREATLKSLEQQHSVAQAGATAWKVQFDNEVENLATSPNFKSTAQIPPEMLASLKDDPTKMTYLEQRAAYNQNHGNDSVGSKDNREYGPGFTQMFLQLHSPAGGRPQITDVNQVYQALADGKLTMAGVDKLTTEMTKPKTPEGASEGVMGASSLKVVQTMLSGEDKIPGMKDPQGQRIYNSGLPAYFKAISDGQAKGIPLSELYNSSSPNWAGNAVKGLIRDPATYYADISQANLPDAQNKDPQYIDQGFLGNLINPKVLKPIQQPTANPANQLNNDFASGKYNAPETKPQGLQAIQSAVKNGKMTRDAGAQLLIKYGYVKAQ